MKGVLGKVTKGPRCLALVLVWLLVFSQNVAMADERVLVYVVSGITYADKNTTYGQHKYNSHWQYWSQGASGYLNGNDPSILHNMPQFGCRVVAQAKLLVEAGLASSSTSVFNPDIYYAWTVANGYQGGSDHVNSPYETSTQGTAIIQWGSNKGITVKKRIEEIDPSMSVYAKAALVMHYINNGYYVLLGNDNHYVYILSAASRARGTPVVSDSSGSYSQNSNQCYTLVSHQGESPYDTIVVFSMDGSSISDPDTQKPSVNTAASSITGVSPVDYYVQVSASDNFYVSKIVTGSWNDVCGIDNAQWQTHYVDGTNASATFKISVSDFGNQINTVYHTNAYAVDACGNRSEIVRVGDILIENTKPVVAEVRVENITPSSYEVYARGTDNGTMYKMQIGTWIGDDIDAAVWQETEGFTSEGRFYVNADYFGGRQNVIYHTNVYAIDLCGNPSEAVRACDLFLESIPPAVTICRAENITTEGCDVVVTASDNSTVKKLQIGIWHSKMSIDDAHWQEVATDGAAACSQTFHIQFSDYADTEGAVFYINAYAFDGCGNVSTALRCDEVPVPEPYVDLYEERVETLTLYLPDKTTAIEQGAFSGVAARYFVLPPTVTTICADAFPTGSTVFLYGDHLQYISADLFSGEGTIVEMFGSGSGNLGDVVQHAPVRYVTRDGRQANYLYWTVDDN